MLTFKERRTWSADRIRTMCINHMRYTRGDNEDYSRMLDFVRENEPTIENIQRVAADIVKHSDMDCYGLDFDECVEGIMFDIANEAVIYGFERR